MKGFRGKEIKAVSDYASALQASAGDGVVMSDTGIGRAVHLAQSELKGLGRPWTGYITFDADGRQQYYIRCGVVVGPDGMFIRPALKYERVPNEETGDFETIELPREYDASGLEIRAVYADEGVTTLYIVLREDLSGYDIANDVDYDETPAEFVMPIADVDTVNREIVPRHNGVVVWRPITDSDGSYGDTPKTRSRSLEVSGDDWLGLRAVGLAGFGGDWDYGFPWRTAYDVTEAGQRAKTECDNTGVIACVKGEPTKLRYYRAWPMYVHGDGDANLGQDSIERYILEHEDGRTWCVLSLFGWWYLGAELPPADKDTVSEEWAVAVWQGGNVAWLNLTSLLSRWEGSWNNGAVDDTYQPQYFVDQGGYAGECLAVPSSNRNDQAWVPLDDYIQQDPFYSAIEDAADDLQTQIDALEIVWRDARDRMSAVYNRILAAEARYAAIVRRVNGLKERVARLKVKG